FSLLLEEVRKRTGQLAYEPTEVLDEAYLRKQVNFIQSLFAYGMVVQSALMAREWVVNWAIWYKAGRAALQREYWLHDEFRDRVEHELSNAFPARETSSCQLVWLDNPKLSDLLKQLWPDLRDLRNDLAHCGMRLSPRPPRALYAQTEEYLLRLHEVMNLSSAG
ncbi:MAG: TM1812 family CRISPR-associated protein, partial [Armatimonadota bacterium]|nr:TM1812 family CRISPR-associated protein [Armatimonadota bacterium]